MIKPFIRLDSEHRQDLGWMHACVKLLKGKFPTVTREEAMKRSATWYNPDTMRVEVIPERQVAFDRDRECIAKVLRVLQDGEFIKVSQDFSRSGIYGSAKRAGIRIALTKLDQDWKVKRVSA